ncbi:MAG: hypothetical protein HY931_01680 [Candidatus Falkowbacteria bacterium]|nr:MAG: hypothetical protein HY931_01680 [Candidatus Falkowbacteria bacterium]
MDIVINTAGIDKFLSLPPDLMFWAFLGNFGWIIIGIFFIYGTIQVYLLWIREKWSETHKNVLLAIDIPKGNEQSPKAVENMFTYLAGAHGSINFFEKWFEGKYQKSFSYEIVSLEGYTQFLIRTPAEYKNLIESSVYSQYPDAEISVVDDYTDAVPQHYPDEEYDVWGTEFMQASSWVYPIKTYKEFEHQMGPSETQFKDPMAALMDLCGSLRQGEQLWIQFLVIPIGFDWVKEAEKEIDKILGRKAKAKPGLAMKGVEALGNASEILYSIWGDVESSKKEEKQKTMMDLTPLEKRRIEGVHEKLSKLSFEAKIRVVYVAKKDVMNKAKVANGIVGYMKQFASLDLNNLKPDVKKTMTKTVYFRQVPRLNLKKNKIFHAYTVRSDGRGISAGILNIEELATLWHFPVEANVKASLVQKAPGRKADAPSSLPLASELTTVDDSFLKTGIFLENKEQRNSYPEKSLSPLEEDNSVPPDNLPFV